MSTSDFPMRINKYLASKGVATRRDADTLVEKGRVFINGRKAVVGDKILSTDIIEVRVTGRKSLEFAYYAYHKPRGVVTHSAQYGDADIAKVLPKELRALKLFPVGRLDKDSSGLIILTNDGRVTDRLLNPTHVHEKEYIVRTKDKLRSSFPQYMEKGVHIEGYDTRPAKVKLVGENSFSIVLTEGKRHQIRRMVVALHNEVVELKRVRVMNIRLGTLPPGEFRAIEGAEREKFLSELGL